MPLFTLASYWHTVPIFYNFLQDTWHVRFYVFMYSVLSCLFRIFDKKKIPKTKEILVKNRTCKRKKMNAWFLCSRHYFSIFLVWLLTIFCIFHFYGFQYNYTPHYRKRYNGFSLLSPLTSPSICPSPLTSPSICPSPLTSPSYLTEVPSICLSPLTSPSYLTEDYASAKKDNSRLNFNALILITSLFNHLNKIRNRY